MQISSEPHQEHTVRHAHAPERQCMVRYIYGSHEHVLMEQAGHATAIVERKADAARSPSLEL